MTPFDRVVLDVIFEVESGIKFEVGIVFDVGAAGDGEVMVTMLLFAPSIQAQGLTEKFLRS